MSEREATFKSPSPWKHYVYRTCYQFGFGESSELLRWSQINASYKTYDRTFGIDSIEEMKQWYSLYPQEKGAVLELAGYGIAPHKLVQVLKDKSIGSFPTYGLALAKELSSEFSTPNAELVAGNLGEIAFSDKSKTISMLRGKLEANGCRKGAALIFLRPVGAYPTMEEENDVTVWKKQDFYINMFTRIAKGLLAPDGTFAIQIPDHLAGINDFIERLRKDLKAEFQVSNLFKSSFRGGRLHNGIFDLRYRFDSVVIRRKKTDPEINSG